MTEPDLASDSPHSPISETSENISEPPKESTSKSQSDSEPKNHPESPEESPRKIGEGKGKGKGRSPSRSQNPDTHKRVRASAKTPTQGDIVQQLVRKARDTKAPRKDPVPKTAPRRGQASPPTPPVQS